MKNRRYAIIELGFTHDDRYQIMYEVRSGFHHVYPGQLFTLEAAKAKAAADGLEIACIGDSWHCLSK
jgi:hypothetical protein